MGLIFTPVFSSSSYKGKVISSSRSKVIFSPSIKMSKSISLSIRASPRASEPNKIVCIKEYHSFLWKKVKAKGHPYRKEIAQSLLLAVFHEVYGMFKNHMPIEVKKSRQEELFAAFIQTLALHHKQERSVAFYAGKLCVTPKYLSLLVKNVSNRTAGEWIDNYVVLEAKALLSSSTLSIQEISDRLNFANQSFFGKYFKQHVGISPTEYRKKW